MRVRGRIFAKFLRASRAEFNSRARSLYGIGAKYSYNPSSDCLMFRVPSLRSALLDLPRLLGCCKSCCGVAPLDNSVSQSSGKAAEREVDLLLYPGLMLNSAEPRIGTRV